MFTSLRLLVLVISVAIFMAPLVVLVVVGIDAASGAPRRAWAWAAALAGVSTIAWLAYVGLFQHETPCGSGFSRCPTVYGYEAPLPEGHMVGTVVLVGGFVLPAAWAGWRRLVPPMTAGAAVAVGPTLLAWWTAPRGDNDGLWTMVFWLLAALGGLAGGVAYGVERVRRRSTPAALPGSDPDGPHAS